MILHGGLNHSDESLNDMWVLIGANLPFVVKEGNSEEALVSQRAQSQALSQETSNRLSWAKVEQMGAVPTPRDSHSSCICADFLYIYGG
jgi:hypothetical protein